MPEECAMARRYSKVATGGTFDQLHAGHERLLDESFAAGDEVVIGLTSDEFARRRGKSPTLSYGEREAALRSYISKRFPGRRYMISKLDDVFGPGITNPDVQALVASPETAETVELANEMRAARGYPPLELVTVGWVNAEDGKPISTTRVKRGEIDREGRLLRGGARGQ